MIFDTLTLTKKVNIGDGKRLKRPFRHLGPSPAFTANFIYLFLQGEEGKRLRAELAVKDRKKMEEIVRKDLEDSSDEER